MKLCTFAFKNISILQKIDF